MPFDHSLKELGVILNRLNTI